MIGRDRSQELVNNSIFPHQKGQINEEPNVHYIPFLKPLVNSPHFALYSPILHVTTSNNGKKKIKKIKSDNEEAILKNSIIDNNINNIIHSDDNDIKNLIKNILNRKEIDENLVSPPPSPENNIATIQINPINEEPLPAIKLPPFLYYPPTPPSPQYIDELNQINSLRFSENRVIPKMLEAPNSQFSQNNYYQSGNNNYNDNNYSENSLNLILNSPEKFCPSISTSPPLKKRKLNNSIKQPLPPAPLQLAIIPRFFTFTKLMFIIIQLFQENCILFEFIFYHPTSAIPFPVPVFLNF